MNFLGDEFVGSGSIDLGSWGTVTIQGGNDPYNPYGYGYPGGGYPYPGTPYPTPYYPSQINWGSILIIALIALVVWKILA